MNREPHRAYFGVGWAKRYVEKLCRFWYEKAGLEVIIARSSNIYGPFAKFDAEVSHFVPALLRKAVDKRDPFEV
jgi:GDP-L-fucose synthase